MKKIILLVALFALVAAIYGYQQWNKPHLDVAAADIDVKIEANALFAAFANDETASNAKYLDKLVKVCGTIADDATSNNGTTTLQLATDDAIGVVLCEFETAPADLAQLRKGKTVCCKGICSGYLSDVVLNRCVIAN